MMLKFTAIIKVKLQKDVKKVRINRSNVSKKHLLNLAHLYVTVRF